MSIKDLLSQVEEFFDLSKKKQRKKQDKLLDLIDSLKDKKYELKKQIKKESKKDKNSKKIYNLCKEFKVLTKLIKKAKKQRDKLDSDEEQSLEDLK